jgi:endonuclease YncB( thermonuclease family)
MADSWQGRVVAIGDGDTLTLLAADNTLVETRLAQIDAPERSQPYGSRARQALVDLVFQKVVRVEGIGIDQYGRTLGTIFVGQMNVNAEMVRIGSAWVYRHYATDSALYDLEEQARLGRRGLWALPESQRMPPWKWRHTRQEK